MCELHKIVRICCFCIHSDLKWPHWDFSTSAIDIHIITPYKNSLNLALKHHKHIYLVFFLPQFQGKLLIFKFSLSIFTVIIPHYLGNSLGNLLTNYMRHTTIFMHGQYCCNQATMSSTILVHHQETLVSICNDKYVHMLFCVCV